MDHRGKYDSWPEEQCRRIDTVDEVVVVSPGTSQRHNRLATVSTDALDSAALSERNADADFDVRLQDVPLTNRRPDAVA